MDLRYSDRDEAFRRELRAWLETEVPKHGAPPETGSWPERRAYDCEWQRKLFDAGFAGIHWPQAYGGRGASLSEQLVYYEETARADAPYVGASFIGLMHGGPTLIAEGTDAQKEHHLPAILKGEHVWCQCFSEPGAGSDLAALQTRAVRRGDEYIVSGQKIWSTRAHIADYAELLVRTDPDAPKHRGITWLILPMQQAGVVVRPLKTLQGDSHFCEVFFEEARVPVANRVGDENDGWRVANVTLRFERGTGFANQIIDLRRQVQQLKSLAQQIQRGGAPAWQDATLRREIGHLAAEVDALWNLLRMVISESARSDAPSLVGSAVKLVFSDLYERSGRLAMRVLGRAALARKDFADLPVEELLHHGLWSIQFAISGGTTQIQKNIIAERVLGQPKDR
jgi:alkylation response protein AidB-like acyl-CoA dehydrogenase